MKQIIFRQKSVGQILFTILLSCLLATQLNFISDTLAQSGVSTSDKNSKSTQNATYSNLANDRLDKLVSAILPNINNEQDIGRAQIRNFEALAEQVASLFLSVGDDVNLAKFIEKFYAQLSRYNAGIDRPAWNKSTEKVKAESISISLQYIRIQSMVLKYETSLSAEQILVKTRAEVLQQRRVSLSKISQNLGLAKFKLQKSRREIDADRYRALKAALLVTSARVSMFTADAAYRLYAPSMINQLLGEQDTTNSSAFYGNARQEIFEAIILDPNNLEAKVLAADIQDRLKWIREGMAFGGLRFFQVEPVMGQFDGPSWTPLARLKDIQNQLSELKNKGLSGSSQTSLNDRLNEFEAQLENRKQHQERQIARISRSISDTKFRIQSGDIDAQAVLNNKADLIRLSLAKSQKTKDEHLKRGETLRKEIVVLANELDSEIAALAEISSMGKLEQATEFREFRKTAKVIFSDTSNVVNAVANLKFKEIAISSKALAESWSEFKSAAGTKIEQLKSEKNKAIAIKEKVEQIQKQVEQDILLLAEENLEAIAFANIKKAKFEIATLRNAVERAKTQGKTGIKEFQEALYKIGIDKIEAAKRAVSGKIADVHHQIDNALSLIGLVKKNKERIEQAISAANLAIAAAAAIPSGIIVGTASGTFTQRPQALMKVQELGIKIIENAQLVEQDINKAKQIINGLKGAINAYEQELSNLGMDELKAQLNKQVEDVKNNSEIAVGQFLEKMDAEQKIIEVQLNKSKGRLVRRFKLSTAKLEASKNEFVAELKGVASDIRAWDQKLDAERRKARQIARRINIIRENLSRRIEEHRSIFDAINKAQSEGVAERREIDDQQEIEASLVNERNAPLIQRLRELEQQTEILVKGGDVNIGALLSDLDAIVSERTVGAEARRRIALLDEGNKYLFQFANWLYLITRETEALHWAISAQSPQELGLAFTKLMAIHQRAQTTIGLAVPRYFAVHISGEKLRKFISPTTRFDGNSTDTIDKFRFSVYPRLSNDESKLPRTVKQNDSQHVGEEPFSIYEPIELYLNSILKSRSGINPTGELIFAPFLESEPGAFHIIWDAWVVPKWSSKVPAELSMIGLRPVGPTTYQFNGSVSEQPVLRDREPNFSATSFTYNRIRRQHEQAMQAVLEGGTKARNLIDGTLPGMNYRSLLGRGLGNTWELVFPKSWSTLNRLSPGFKDLESVDIVFGYLISSEREKDIVLSSKNSSQQRLPVFPPKEECNSAVQAFDCKLKELVRHIYRNHNLKKMIPVGKDQQQFENYYQFDKSIGATSLRLEVLEELARSMPKAKDFKVISNTELPEGGNAHEGTIFEYFFDQRENRDSTDVNTRSNEVLGAFEVFQETFCIKENPQIRIKCLEDEIRNQLPFTVEEITHQIVRDEMLGMPDEAAAPIGPIELLRVWRSLEGLLGNFSDRTDDYEVTNNSDVSTMRSELIAIERRLSQLSNNMKEVKSNLASPVALVRRLVDDYEMSRTQMRFVKELSQSISDNSAVATEQSAQLEKLKKILVKARAYHCLHCSWSGYLRQIMI